MKTRPPTPLQTFWTKTKRLLRKMSTLNGVFAAAAAALLLWGAVFLYVGYGWLPNFVASETILIQNYVGTAYEQALEKARQDGARVQTGKTVYEHSEEVPAGVVISHAPRPGQTAKAARPIVFTVSKGPDYVAAPLIAGVPQREAELQIAAAGLKVGHASFAFSDQLIDSGIVIASTPQGGEQTLRNSKVNLLISLGPRKIDVQVPSLIGKRIDDAKTILAERGLRLGDIQTAPNRRGAAEQTVLSQNPLPGADAETGTAVQIFVNPAASETRWVVASHTVTGDPTSEKQVRLVIQDRNGRHILVNAVYPGGKEISVPRTVVGNAALYIYETDMEKPIAVRTLR